MTRKRARGFTLIELMIVVTIIGLLASMAIPTYARLTLRSKQAERHEVMVRIKKAVADYYLQHGTTNDADGHALTGAPQPPTIPGSTKLMPNWTDTSDHWRDVFRTAEEIEGAVYFQYSFTCAEAAGATPATLLITATGDLDGDGVPNTRWVKYTRINGSYVVVDPARDEHEDMDGSF